MEVRMYVPEQETFFAVEDEEAALKVQDSLYKEKGIIVWIVYLN